MFDLLLAVAILAQRRHFSCQALTFLLILLRISSRSQGGNGSFQKHFTFLVIQQHLHHLLAIMPMERQKENRKEGRKAGRKEGQERIVNKGRLLTEEARGERGATEKYYGTLKLWLYFCGIKGSQGTSQTHLLCYQILLAVPCCQCTIICLS